ncbi:MAG: class I SAM-dependent methyltransferase [Thermoplasmata archaeon]
MDPPDYESYDYLGEWRNREILDLAERKLIMKLAGRPKKTLELGGGFGRITSVLERISEETYMVDFSSRNLEEAKKRLIRTQLRRCNFFNLPFESGLFDLIVMVRVMHHISNPTLVYDEILRVGRKGASVIISVPYSPLSKMREIKEIREVETKLGVHKIYYGPPETYLDKRMSLEAIFGTGLLDNRIGKKLHKLTFLSFFDVTTARFWKLKNNLFLKFRLPD